LLSITTNRPTHTIHSNTTRRSSDLKHIFGQRADAGEEALSIGQRAGPERRRGARTMGRAAHAVGDPAGERLLCSRRHPARARKGQGHEDTKTRRRHSRTGYSAAPSFFSSATVLGWASSIGGSKPRESAPAGAAARPLPAVEPNIAARSGVIPRVFFMLTAAPC